MYTKHTKLECMWEREREVEGPEKWKIDLEMLDSLRPSDIFSGVSFLLLSLEEQKILTEKVWEKIYRFLSHISEIFDFVINPAVDIGTYGRPVVFLCLRLWILLRLRVGFHHCFYSESSLRNRERERKRAQWRLLWEICMS